jgi:hypothetical protein
MGMSNFNDKDVEKVKKWGNAAAKKYWMASYNKTLYPVPDRRDASKMKDFMRSKYIQKRFLEENNQDNSSGSDDSDSSDKEKKKKKKTKKAKKPKKKKKKATSSEEDSNSSESEEEQKVEEKKAAPKVKFTKPTPGKGLGVPRTKQSNDNKAAKATKAPVKQEKPKEDSSNILDFDFDTPAEPTGTTSGNNDDTWANFGGENQKNNNSSNQNDMWSAFDTKSASEKKTNDLLGSLGDLYNKAAPQQQQYPQFNNQQNMMGQGFPPGFNPQVMQQMQQNQMQQNQMQQNQAQTNMGGGANSDDPFAMVLQEQQKQQYENMQKAQAAKQNQQKSADPAPSNGNTGVTPNMFFQQMMQMMQNQGQNNPNQQAMMMAAMQNMMGQMSVNPQAQQQQQQEAEPEQPVPPPQQDKSNGAFKNLFSNAAATSVGSGQRHSNLNVNTSDQNSSAFGNFDSGAFNKGQPRSSDPQNPFGNFGGQAQTQPQAQAQPNNNMFDTQFSNSGFSGGNQNSGQNKGTKQGASSNPFDMFK